MDSITFFKVNENDQHFLDWAVYKFKTYFVNFKPFFSNSALPIFLFVDCLLNWVNELLYYITI